MGGRKTASIARPLRPAPPQKTGGRPSPQRKAGRDVAKPELTTKETRQGKNARLELGDIELLEQLLKDLA